MLANKNINKICCVIMASVVLLTAVIMAVVNAGYIDTTKEMAYESSLFDTTKVHTVNIVVDENNWQNLLDNASKEEYIACNVVINGETVKNVGIRAKGNSSLATVANSDSDRYSFKIEFDHYEDSTNYLGLDKLSLNNIIQDNTYMKDYISYQILRNAGVSTPLCSFVWITVNNQDWGLYLAVEAVEESFAERNYGSEYGNIYKPDSMDIGDMGNEDGNRMQRPENAQGAENSEGDGEGENSRQFPGNGNQGEMPKMNGEMPDMSEMPKMNGGMPDMSEMPKMNGEMPDMGGGKGMFGRNNSDVQLIYSDDDHDSYSSIFENAVFDVNDSDKDRLISSLKQLNEQENLEEVLDIEEVIQYFVGHNFVLNEDSYTGSLVHNYYLRESDGVLSMIPWDYNLAFGGMSFNSSDADTLVNSPIDTPASTDMESLPMLLWIFEDETYTDMYHEAFDSLITNYFESGEFEEEIDRVIEMISPYVEKDPTAFCTYEEFITASEELKEFCLLRAESIRGQLDGTIASTEEGQAKDSSGFVDASMVDIESMGSQNSNMGGMGGNKQNFRKESEASQQSEQNL